MGDIVKQILAKPIQLVDQASKGTDEATSFKQECIELKSKTEKLATLLRQAASARSALYERPSRCIIDDTEQVLSKALSLVLKCCANKLMKPVKGEVRIPQSLEGRSKQASGTMRHGPLPGLSSAAGRRSLESLPPPQLLENKIAAQEAEIERLAGDNHRLANTHVALREALVTATQDAQKLKSHIRSIQTESDIQIRVLLDKIAKMEVDIRAGDSVKKDLQQAHIEAQSLAASSQELGAQIQRATQELKKAHSDVKGIPDLQAELDGLVQEHRRLRAMFEYEKSKNIELVEQMKAKEKNLIDMAREVEMLRAEILNTEKKANAPNLFGAGTPVDSNGPFADAYGRVHGPIAVGQVGESKVPYGDSNGVAAASSGGAVWAGPYDPSVARR